MLGPGVDVAQAALERVLVEDRGGAGGVVDARDDVARLLDRPGRGEAQLPVPFGRELAVAFGILPHVLEGRVDRGARRAQLRLALRDLGLDHVVLAQGLAGAARDLVARQFDEGFERAAGDAERHVREPHRIDHAAGEPVEEAGLAPLGRVVAREGVFLRHEQILDPVAVAAGAAQSDDLPVVDDLGL